MKIKTKEDALKLLESFRERLLFVYPSKERGNYRWGEIEKEKGDITLIIWHFGGDEMRKRASQKEAVNFIWEKRKFINKGFFKD